MSAKLEIQFELPCEEPEHNVRVKRGKRVTTIFLPTNYPNAHKLTIEELLEIVKDKK